jgi:hypothetical protein
MQGDPQFVFRYRRTEVAGRRMGERQGLAVPRPMRRAGRNRDFVADCRLDHHSGMSPFVSVERASGVPQPRFTRPRRSRG